MSCTTAVLSLFLLGPCSEEAGPEHVVATMYSAGGAAAAAVASASRPASDREADARRKPAEVLEFVGIEPGMAVLDLFAGGGYYTEIISELVGDNGHVLAHNNAAYIPYTEDALAQRKREGRLQNVDIVVSEADDLELAPSSLDAAMLVLVWHDLYYADAGFNWPDADEARLLSELCDALRPGAPVGVIDHVANPGGDVGEVAQRLHRIDPAVVRSAFTGSCFQWGGETDILANADDDHTLPMSDPAVRGNTDRFVMRFIRK